VAPVAFYITRTCAVASRNKFYRVLWLFRDKAFRLRNFRSVFLEEKIGYYDS